MLGNRIKNYVLRSPRFFFSEESHRNGKKSQIDLPVLNSLVASTLSNFKEPPLKKTAVFYVHHALQTSVNLVEGIIELGARRHNIFVLDKHYSKCPDVADKIADLGVYYQPCSAQTSLGGFSNSFIRDINWLWLKVSEKLDADIEEILILDHGGHALSYIPYPLLEKYKVVGVEKTTGGLINLDGRRSLPPFPVINVAGCAAKKVLESPLIAQAVVTKLLPLFPLASENLTCAVVGYGSIGRAIAQKLRSLGHRVIVCDTNKEQLKTAKINNGLPVTNELTSALASADYIFGCSGHDITAESLEPFRLCSKGKTLISCSSEDKEFLSLIQSISQNTNKKRPILPLSNLSYKTDLGATINIVNGGFPVNFDSSGESVPAQDIQLTRTLVLAAVVQAVNFFRNEHLLGASGIYKLDPSLQQFVTKAWLDIQPSGRIPEHVVQNFQNKEWIIDHSGGIDASSDTAEASALPSFTM